MTDEAPAATPLEPEIHLPSGVDLERLTSGDERVGLRYPIGNRALVALPRVALFVGGVFALAQAWRHHVFIAFWIFGLPFLRRLGGRARGSLLIGRNQLELEGARLFGASLVLPRARITSIEVTRANLFQSFQRAIRVRMTNDGRFCSTPPKRTEPSNPAVAPATL